MSSATVKNDQATMAGGRNVGGGDSIGECGARKYCMGMNSVAWRLAAAAAEGVAAALAAANSEISYQWRWWRNDIGGEMSAARGVKNISASRGIALRGAVFVAVLRQAEAAPPLRHLRGGGSDMALLLQRTERRGGWRQQVLGALLCTVRHLRRTHGEAAGKP
jgi:hypothetical protein